MKNETPQHSDSGLRLLTLTLALASWSQEYSLIVTGEQLLLLQTTLESISSKRIPAVLRNFKLTYTKSLTNHVFVLLECQTESMPKLNFSLRATLTKVPSNTSKTILDMLSNSPVGKDKPPQYTQQQADFYGSYEDWERLVNEEIG